MSSIGDKFNSAAGGGKESEKNEDMLDKGTLTSPQPFIAPLRICKHFDTDYLRRHRHVPGEGSWPGTTG